MQTWWQNLLFSNPFKSFWQGVFLKIEDTLRICQFRYFIHFHTISREWQRLLHLSQLAFTERSWGRLEGWTSAPTCTGMSSTWGYQAPLSLRGWIHHSISAIDSGTTTRCKWKAHSILRPNSDPFHIFNFAEIGVIFATVKWWNFWGMVVHPTMRIPKSRRRWPSSNQWLESNFWPWPEYARITYWWLYIIYIPPYLRPNSYGFIIDWWNPNQNHSVRVSIFRPLVAAFQSFHGFFGPSLRWKLHQQLVVQSTTSKPNGRYVVKNSKNPLITVIGMAVFQGPKTNLGYLCLTHSPASKNRKHHPQEIPLKSQYFSNIRPYAGA